MIAKEEKKMHPNEQQLIDMIRNAKNPEKALTTAAAIIIAFLQAEKGGEENA